MNYRNIIFTLGWVLNIEAVCMILPMVCSLVYREDTFSVYLISALICLAVGFLCTFRQPKNKSMYAREGFVTVALSWIVLSVFGTMPFVFSGGIPNFIDALFETVSGFTTTGSTILTDIESLPKSLLFWRSFTHWIGGMGVLVFLVAIVPLHGGKNMHLLRAESTGAEVTKLVPKVKSSAMILYGIYTGLTVLQIILLLAGGMSFYDAVTTSFSTAGTGGFSANNDSLVSYSPYIQHVVTVFMIIFGIDFSVYFLILMRKFKIGFRSEEVRKYLLIILLATLVICYDCRGLYASVSENITHSAFQVASIITTTGFMTTDYVQWPALSQTILVLLMFIGSCAGSTGGGIKVSRIIILIKSVFKEIKICAHPNTVYKVKLSGRTVEHETMRSINVFFVSYIAIYVVSLLCVSLDNYDFTTNFSSIATMMNNVGPGLNLVGPTQNFSFFSPFSKLVFVFDMLAGRLEIFPMLMLFSRHTWRR